MALASGVTEGFFDMAPPKVENASLPAQGKLAGYSMMLLYTHLKQVPVLSSVAGTTLKFRHWKAIFDAMDKHYFKDRGYTVGTLLTAGICERESLPLVHMTQEHSHKRGPWEAATVPELFEECSHVSDSDSLDAFCLRQGCMQGVCDLRSPT